MTNPVKERYLSLLQTSELVLVPLRVAECHGPVVRGEHAHQLNADLAI